MRVRIFDPPAFATPLIWSQPFYTRLVNHSAGYFSDACYRPRYPSSRRSATHSEHWALSFGRDVVRNRQWHMPARVFLVSASMMIRFALVSVAATRISSTAEPKVTRDLTLQQFLLYGGMNWLIS